MEFTRKEECPAVLLKQLYLAMRTMENRVGGGEGVEGIYGSITETGVSKIMEALAECSGLGPSSTLVDVGAGLGRPLLHAMVAQGVPRAWGIEVDPVKCQKASVFLEKSLELLRAKAEGARADSLYSVSPEKIECPLVDCSPIETIKSLDPATHVYSFWEGIPSVAKRALARLFTQSHTCKAIALVQRAMRTKEGPLQELHQLGFAGVEIVNTFPVKMSGSGRTFRAYVICKTEQKTGHVEYNEPLEDAEGEIRIIEGSKRQEKRIKASSPSLIPFRKIKKNGTRKAKKERKAIAI
jgi:hypothetical protein